MACHFVTWLAIIALPLAFTSAAQENIDALKYHDAFCDNGSILKNTESMFLFILFTTLRCASCRVYTPDH